MVKPPARDDEVTARTPQVPQPTAVPPNQDFSPQAAYTRDLAKSEDYRETRRELQRYLGRVEEQQFDFTWQRNQTIEHYQNVAEQLEQREKARQQKPNLSDFPQMNQWVNSAKSAGYEISEDDIKNLVDYSILNDAADVVIAGLRPEVQDPYVADNVLLTLAETDPVAASFLPSIIEAKLIEQGENENSILNNPVMRWLGNNKVLRDLAGTAGTFVSATLYPFMEAFDWSMEGARGATYRQYRSPLGETPLSWVPMAQGFFSSEDRRAATGLNENYIQAIRDAQNPDGTPMYQPIEVDVVVDLVQLQMDGDPYPAATLINGKYNGDMQAAKVITDLAYNRSTSNVQELVRQVQSANMSNTGQALLGAVSPDPNFNEARGSQVRDNLADVTGVVAGFALDPTNAAFGLGRAFQAARWSLTKLAPGVNGADSALAVMRRGPDAMARTPKFNPAYRFADNFTKDLNTYDDLLRRSSEARKAGDTQKAVKLRSDAAELRARMANDYDNMPEQLIEDFYKQMPRNADGKFDVQTYATWIDDGNKAYVTLVGDVIPVVQQAGAADAAKRAVLAQLLATESGDGARAAAKSVLATLDQEVAPELAEQVRPILDRVAAARTDEIGRDIAERALTQFGQEYQGMVAPLIKQITDAHDRLFYSQVGRVTERRTPLIPRMSAVAAARKDAVNGIKISQSRSGVIDKMIAKYLPRVENPAEFAEDFSASAEEIGQAIRSYKTGGEMAPLSGTADSISKMLSSLPSVAVLSTTDASSTKAFYRFARAFMPKRFARLIADEWRAGTSGSRRKMLNALIRSSAASRGIRLTEQQAEELATRFAPSVGDLGTGTKTGEQYGITVVGGVLPSERAAIVAGAQLTDEGKEALTYYTQTAYGDINNYLRNADEIAARRQRTREIFGEDAPLEMPDPLDATVAALDDATKASVASADMVVYRGTGLPDDLIPREGQTVSFPEFLSTTTDEGLAVRWTEGGGTVAPDDASKFLGESMEMLSGSGFFAEGLNKVYWTIQVPKGSRFADMKALGVRGDQEEILLPRNSQLKITKVEEITDPETGEIVGRQVFAELDQKITPSSQITTDLDPSVKASLSADRNGIEHALHLDDTAGAIRIPTMKDFENLRREQGLIAQGYHMMGTPLQSTTDVMSYLTLAGPRFSLRNAVEEDGLFIASGGGVFNLAKGRVMDQWLRRANPRLVPVSNAKGEVELVRKTSLGMIANKMEWLSLRAKERGLPEWFSEFIYSTVSKSEIEDALLAKQAGHMEPLQELLVKTQVAHAIGKNRWNILSREDKEVFRYFADSPYGMALYDQVAGHGQYLNSGDFPRFMFDQNSITDAFPGITYGKVRPSSPIKFSGYDNIPPVQVDDVTGQRILGVSAWWRQLEKTLVGDGDIGEAAVRLLDNPQAAKAEVARIIREDKTFGYKEKLSRISDDMSIDEFANSYVENVFQHFTKADGSLNNELRSRLLSVDPETGQLRASLWKPSTAAEGAETYALRMSDLEDMPMADRPSYVFGPIVDETPQIPIAETEAMLISPTRGYGWMGRQNARISKGPIFMANLANAWKQTTGPRARLAQTMAEAAGRTKPNADDIDLANRLYFKNSADQAFSNTISYIDNPANRSNIAWKARNVSRYYRATEDFWRRMKRVAVNRPETFWKIALTYHLLEDTGFVFKDEEGAAYFSYPGNQQLQQAIAAAGMIFFERDTSLFKYLNTNPFFIGGKVTGITPSTDPLQQVPSVFGPISIPLVAIYNAFPALYKMKGLQKLTLGEYQPVTGDTARDSLAAATPPLVQRILGLLDIEQFDSTVAQGAIDTMAIMAANGSLDELTINGKTVPASQITSASQFRKSDEYVAANQISVAATITRVFFQTFGMAAPQMKPGDVSKEARDFGITGMKPLFRTFVDENIDAPDPYAVAFSQFVGAQLDAMKAGDPVSLESFLPFTMSSFEYPTDSPDAARASLARPQIGTEEWRDWFDSDDTKELIDQGFYNSALYLAPRKGEFDFASWILGTQTLGLRKKKSHDQAILDLLALQGEFLDSQIRNSYNEQIAAIDSTTQAGRDEIKSLQEQRDSERKNVKIVNQPFDLVSGQRFEQYTDANYRATFGEMGQMLDYIEKRDGKLTGTSQQLRNAMNIFLYYNQQIDSLQGPGPQRNAKKLDLQAQMEQELNAISQVDPNAEVFIESVVKNLSYQPEFPQFGVQ